VPIVLHCKCADSPDLMLLAELENSKIAVLSPGRFENVLPSLSHPANTVMPMLKLMLMNKLAMVTMEGLCIGKKKIFKSELSCAFWDENPNSWDILLEFFEDLLQSYSVF
jgi:hypothetical protein